MNCQVCQRAMHAHLNRLSRIELTGEGVDTITMKLSSKGDHQDSGLKLSGKAGCRRCLSSEKILGMLMPQLAAASGQPWTHATVVWHDGKRFVPVAREALAIPKPVEHRQVATTTAP